ncbi:hypothetical protein MKW94_026587 [Papaver nudicaule]|uniref:DNA helicase Pif1-like 2B domain-containing protein n=1 Tax=Papaver nudicaule TaxID=74823 RepID=A0AA42B0S9_PAPNU|nr:hypothetical protein [Papaver nudicaule]
MFPGEEHTYYSFDSVEDNFHNIYQQEYLNGTSPGRLPPHELKLSIGAPIILLRNVDANNGLYNDDTRGKMWQGQSSYKAEPLGLIPKVTEQCSEIINPSLDDTVTEYLDNGCPLLAYILAAQEVTHVENRSTLSFRAGNVNVNNNTGAGSSITGQGGNVNNSSTTFRKDITVLQTTVIPDSCISNLVNPLKRKPNEEHPNYEYLGQSHRKLITFDANTITYGF